MIVKTNPAILFKKIYFKKVRATLKPMFADQMAHYHRFDKSGKSYIGIFLIEIVFSNDLFDYLI